MELLKGFRRMYGGTYGCRTKERWTDIRCSSFDQPVFSFSTGGPQTDIVDVGANGFLATTAEEYAKCLKEVLCADGRKFSGMQAHGRRKADLFSDERFREGFVEALERGMPETKKQQ
jgi:hypothetical protein